MIEHKKKMAVGSIKPGGNMTDNLIKPDNNVVREEIVIKNTNKFSLSEDNDDDDDEIIIINKNKENLINNERKLPGEAMLNLQPISINAKLRRNAFIRSMKLDQSVHDNLITDQVTNLKYIIKHYVSTNEKRESIKRAKQYLEQFEKLRGTLAADPFLSLQEKAETLYNFVSSFGHDIEIYRTAYKNENMSASKLRRTERMLKRYDSLISYFEDAESPDIAITDEGIERLGLELGGNGSSGLLAEARNKTRNTDDHAGLITEEVEEGQTVIRQKHNTAPVYWLNKRKIDSTLNGDQLEGIRKTDSYLVEISLNSKKRLPFVSKIFELSQRERLMIYYMIEKDTLESMNMTDLALSQISYNPNPDVIKSKMSRTRFFRIWEKGTDDGMMAHHWEKLEAGLRMVKADKIKKAIENFSVLRTRGDDVDIERLEKKEAIKRAKDLLGENRDSEEYKNLENELGRLNQLERERARKLDEAIISLQKCKEAIEASDSAWINKKKKSRAKAAAIQDAKDKMAGLAIVDAELMKSIRNVNMAVLPSPEPGEKVDTTYTERASALSATAVMLTGKAVGTLAKINMIPPIFKYMENDVLKTTTISVGSLGSFGALEGIYYTSGMLSTVSGVMGLIQSAIGLKKMIKSVSSGDIGTWDAVGGIARSGMAIANSIGGTGLGITTLYFGDTMAANMMGVKSVAQTMQGVSKGIGITALVMGSIGFASDVTDGVLQIKGAYHRSQAKTKLASLESRGAFRNNEDDKAYIDGLLKLDGRNKTRKAIGTTLSAVSNAGNVVSGAMATAAAFTGVLAAAVPFVMAGWAAVSFGITIASKITDYFLASSSRKKSAEEFLQLDNIVKPEDMPQEVRNNSKKQTAFKRTLMEHMAAELGFTTFRSLFKQITVRYATFLHNRLFFKKNEGEDEYSAIYDEDNKEGTMSEMCALVLKGMGLKVKYPRRNAVNRDRHPSIAAITAKLGA